MKTQFKVNEASTTTICNYYPELTLNGRINAKGTMLAQLACKGKPGIYLHLKAKYNSKNDKGELKQIQRRLDNQSINLLR